MVSGSLFAVPFPCLAVDGVHEILEEGYQLLGSGDGLQRGTSNRGIFCLTSCLFAWLLCRSWCDARNRHGDTMKSV